MTANKHTVYPDTIKEQKRGRTWLKIKIKYTDQQRRKVLKMPQNLPAFLIAATGKKKDIFKYNDRGQQIDQRRKERCAFHNPPRNPPPCSCLCAHSPSWFFLNTLLRPPYQWQTRLSYFPKMRMSTLTCTPGRSGPKSHMRGSGIHKFSVTCGCSAPPGQGLSSNDRKEEKKKKQPSSQNTSETCFWCKISIWQRSDSQWLRASCIPSLKHPGSFSGSWITRKWQLSVSCPK